MQHFGRASHYTVGEILENTRFVVRIALRLHVVA